MGCVRCNPRKTATGCDAIANGGIYRYHLWPLWVQLQEKPCLAKADAEVVAAGQSISLHPLDTYRLDSLGLICFDGDRILPSCELYRIYFAKQLSKIV
ncbi:hypothetical protein NIES4074_01430 [Cylindrospermum sp. NIES-4074]|nr:hypothetical protein NIES4074_01430 [Cylindrospermum sp. NIES-4074]